MKLDCPEAPMIFFVFNFVWSAGLETPFYFKQSKRCCLQLKPSDSIVRETIFITVFVRHHDDQQPPFSELLSLAVIAKNGSFSRQTAELCSWVAGVWKTES